MKMKKEKSKLLAAVAVLAMVIAAFAMVPVANAAEGDVPLFEYEGYDGLTIMEDGDGMETYTAKFKVINEVDLAKIGSDGAYTIASGAFIDIHKDGKIVVKNGAKLTIEDGSKVFVQGSIIVEKGAELNLGTQELVIVGGTLDIQAGAKVTVTGTPAVKLVNNAKMYIKSIEEKVEDITSVISAEIANVNVQVGPGSILEMNGKSAGATVSAIANTGDYIGTSVTVAQGSNAVVENKSLAEVSKITFVGILDETKDAYREDAENDTDLINDPTEVALMDLGIYGTLSDNELVTVGATLGNTGTFYEDTDGTAADFTADVVVPEGQTLEFANAKLVLDDANGFVVEGTMKFTADPSKNNTDDNKKFIGYIDVSGDLTVSGILDLNMQNFDGTGGKNLMIFGKGKATITSIDAANMVDGMWTKGSTKAFSGISGSYWVNGTTLTATDYNTAKAQVKAFTVQGIDKEITLTDDVTTGYVVTIAGNVLVPYGAEIDVAKDAMKFATGAKLNISGMLTCEYDNTNGEIVADTFMSTNPDVSAKTYTYYGFWQALNEGIDFTLNTEVDTKNAPAGVTTTILEGVTVTVTNTESMGITVTEDYGLVIDGTLELLKDDNFTAAADEVILNGKIVFVSTAPANISGIKVGTTLMRLETFIAEEEKNVAATVVGDIGFSDSFTLKGTDNTPANVTLTVGNDASIVGANGAVITLDNYNIAMTGTGTATATFQTKDAKNQLAIEDATLATIGAVNGDVLFLTGTSVTGEYSILKGIAYVKTAMTFAADATLDIAKGAKFQAAANVSSPATTLEGQIIISEASVITLVGGVVVKGGQFVKSADSNGTIDLSTFYVLDVGSGLDDKSVALLENSIVEVYIATPDVTEKTYDITEYGTLYCATGFDVRTLGIEVDEVSYPKELVSWFDEPEAATANDKDKHDAGLSTITTATTKSIYAVVGEYGYSISAEAGYDTNLTGFNYKFDGEDVTLPTTNTSYAGTYKIVLPADDTNEYVISINGLPFVKTLEFEIGGNVVAFEITIMKAIPGVDYANPEGGDTPVDPVEPELSSNVIAGMSIVGNKGYVMLSSLDAGKAVDAGKITVTYYHLVEKTVFGVTKTVAESVTMTSTIPVVNERMKGMTMVSFTLPADAVSIYVDYTGNNGSAATSALITC